MQDNRLGIELENERLRVHILECKSGTISSWFIDEIQYRTNNEWIHLLSGKRGNEFSSSIFNMDAQTCELSSDMKQEVKLTCENEWWSAVRMVEMNPETGMWKRKTMFRVKKAFSGSFHSDFLVENPEAFRYTYPLQVYDIPLLEVPFIKCDPAWAVPLPCHILSNNEVVIIYGIERNESVGTIYVQPAKQDKQIRLGVSYPEMAGNGTTSDGVYDQSCLGEEKYDVGQEIEINEFIGMSLLQSGEVSLLVAEKMAACVLLDKSTSKSDRFESANALAQFFHHSQLWQSDAFNGYGGWFRNMWVYIMTDKPRLDPYFDLGWGEGYGVMTMQGLARTWKRTGDVKMKAYLDEMTNHIDCFRRRPDETGVYFDRFHQTGDLSITGKSVSGGADFLGYKRIWSHSLGNIGYQLLDLYRTLPDYPDRLISEKWLSTGIEIGKFFAGQQKENGDIQDGFDEENKEVNQKGHRIPARAIVCGLWSQIFTITGEGDYLERAMRLAEFVSDDIEKYSFYNQMIDTHIISTYDGQALDTKLYNVFTDFLDGENASYALVGLTELFLVTHDDKAKRLCQISAAFLFSWVYYYNLPNGYHGWTRGGTTCRMTDYPLLYTGAGALAYISLCRLSANLQDPFYYKMAEEILSCIAKYQWNDVGKPWNGGIVHALDQRDGTHWGPDKLGQVDSGMTSGMGLADLEYWIEHCT